MEGLADMMEGPMEVEEMPERMKGTAVMTTAVLSIISLGPEEVEGPMEVIEGTFEMME